MSQCAMGERAQAEAITRMLVGQRLAARVQIMKIESVNRWEGACTATTNG